MTTFKAYRNIINSLYENVSNWINKEEYLNGFKSICERHDNNLRQKPNKDNWKKSKVRILLEVYERIQLVELLDEEVKNESGQIIKRYSYPPLRTYLLLTCFDQLGQPENRQPFNDWLISAKKKVERENIISEIEEDDKLQFAKALYVKHNEIYGVKNSFIKFLRKVITENSRETLFSKIKITNNYTSIGNVIGEYIDGDLPDLEKEKYLYSIRNDYTHNTSYSKAHLTEITGNYIPKDGWKLVDTVFKNSEEFGVFFSIDFDDYLKEVVLIGVAENIKQIS
ncbi:hypothetical protein [Winogradskyella pacifica]|uniref:hypothetical protein n=1 Tax=Winogradskyella pacifica TaxID=664642 RepID=UPI0015CD99CC|nr:hypothetical protein [Winogradskyella pacifica]